MKKLLLLLCLVHMFMTQQSVAQVSINTDGANPPASAMLEVKSTDKGFLPPKMTTAQMLAIQNPEIGLMIFNIDEKLPYFFDGNNWIQVAIGEPECSFLLVPYKGMVYHAIKIGNQCWLRENLDVGSMINGATASSDNGSVEKYYYNNNPVNNDYGGLYTWDEMMQYSLTEGVNGICPTGWHIPTDTEWTSLINFLGGSNVAGGSLKQEYQVYWDINGGTTNWSNFSALGAGYGVSDGSYWSLRRRTLFYSSTQYATGHAYCYELVNTFTYILRVTKSKTDRCSVRCIKDN